MIYEREYYINGTHTTIVGKGNRIDYESEYSYKVHEEDYLRYFSCKLSALSSDHAWEKILEQVKSDNQEHEDYHPHLYWDKEYEEECLAIMEDMSWQEPEEDAPELPEWKITSDRITELLK